MKKTEEKKEKSKILQLGNTGFNIDHVKHLSEAEFKKQFKKIVKADIDETWKKVSKWVKNFKD